MKKFIAILLLICAIPTASEAKMDHQKADAQALVNALLPFAEKMLNEQGGFYPFGAYVNTRGNVELAGASNGLEHPTPSDLISLLHNGMAQGAKDGKIQCSGIAYDGRYAPPGSTEKGDAVIIEIEHKSGYNAKIAFPYKKVGSSIQFSPAAAMPGAHYVFP